MVSHQHPDLSNFIYPIKWRENWLSIWRTVQVTYINIVHFLFSLSERNLWPFLDKWGGGVRGREKMGGLQPRYGTSCWIVRPQCKVLWALESRGPWCSYQGGQQVRWDTVSSPSCQQGEVGRACQPQGGPWVGGGLSEPGGGWCGDGLSALLCPALSTPPVLFQYPEP